MTPDTIWIIANDASGWRGEDMDKALHNSPCFARTKYVDCRVLIVFCKTGTSAMWTTIAKLALVQGGELL